MVNDYVFEYLPMVSDYEDAFWSEVPVYKDEDDYLQKTYGYQREYESYLQESECVGGAYYARP